MNTAEIDALAGKWIMEAQKHEMAAREIDDQQDEEAVLHREVAATLYQCAQDLQFPETALKPYSKTNECPSCHEQYTDGQTCRAVGGRGGCPMGGDF